MVEINDDTTKIMLDNTSSPFLVHKGSFDRISKILEEKSIQFRKFASFSDGLPFVPVHGDTVIIFDKNRLIKKKNKFLKIQYNADFLTKNKDVMRYLMEDKSEEELLKDVFKDIDVLEKKYKFNLDKLSTAEKNEVSLELDRLNQIKDKIKSNPLNYFIGIFELEKEILSNSPFNFDLDDVKYIISNALIKRYYKIHKEIEDKIFFLEEYCPAEIAIGSPLFTQLKQQIVELEKMNVVGIDKEVFLAFHTINAIILHPEWKQYVKPIKRPESQIPERWEIILKNIHHFPNNQLKVSVIDYIFRCYILHKFQPKKDYEDELYNEVLKNL